MANTPELPTVTATRTAPGVYTARTTNGVEISIGQGPEQVNPVELLQMALLGCEVLSAEAQLSSRLGADFQAEVHTRPTYDRAANRITDIDVELSADMSGLDVDQQQALIASAQKFIDRLCTVKRSLNEAVQTPVEVRPRAGA